MHGETGLQIVLLMALAIIVLPLFESAQGPSEDSVERIDWPDTPAGRWADGFSYAHHTEGHDVLRSVVARRDLAAYLRIGPVAEPPCFDLAWRIRNVIMCKDRREIMR